MFICTLCCSWCNSLLGASAQPPPPGWWLYVMDKEIHPIIVQRWSYWDGSSSNLIFTAPASLGLLALMVLALNCPVLIAVCFSICCRIFLFPPQLATTLTRFALLLLFTTYSFGRLSFTADDQWEGRRFYYPVSFFCNNSHSYQQTILPVHVIKYIYPSRIHP